MVRSRMPWFEEAWIPGGPDWDALWKLAETQGGVFTNVEARSCGVRQSLLSYYARRNVFERVHRGVYRLRWPPPGPIDRIRAAWIFAGRERAAVSHESALFLWNLLPMEPTVVDLTLPRSRRGKIPASEIVLNRRIRLHVPRVWPSDDLAWCDGIQLTTPERAILDTVSRVGEMEAVVRKAVDDGLVDAGRLLSRARARGGYVRQCVERVLPRNAS